MLYMMWYISDIDPRGSYSRVLRCRERTTDYEYVAKVVHVEGDSMLRGKAWQPYWKSVHVTCMFSYINMHVD